MRNRVVVTPAAAEDMRTAFRYIRRNAPRAARQWLKGLRERIQSLDQNAERAQLAPESASFEHPIRQLLFGKGNRGTYRILFTVLEGTVFVLHVRHGSRLPVEPE